MGVSSLTSPIDLTLKPVKFLCSYGGRILPRYPDGKLRYHGGETRVLAVDISISFADLMVKMGEMCGSTVTVTLKCQLPAEDLDALVSITSDEDLANLIEEYVQAASAAAPSYKMRVFLSVPKLMLKSLVFLPPSPPKSPLRSGLPPRCPGSAKRSSRPPAYPVLNQKAARKIPKQFAYQYYTGLQGNGGLGLFHVVHNGNICQ